MAELAALSEMMEGLQEYGPNAFGGGFECEEIQDVDLNLLGDIVFKIKVRGLVESEFVLGDVANKQFPHLVMEFYESRLGLKSHYDLPPVGPSEFDRGLEPEKITKVGLCSGGEFWMTVKWKYTGRTSYVRIDEAKTRCPNLVIAYYEEEFKPRLCIPRQEQAATEGFGRGLQVQIITKMGYVNEPELQVWIKWIDCPTVDQVPSREAFAKCPQPVIDRYVLELEFPYLAEIPIDEPGFEAQKLLGVRHTPRGLAYIVKWKNFKHTSLVFAEDMDSKCPQIVIDFLDKEFKKKYPPPL